MLEEEGGRKEWGGVGGASPPRGGLLILPVGGLLISILPLGCWSGRKSGGRGTAADVYRYLLPLLLLQG